MFKKMLLIMISISMINTIVTNASERQKVIEQINEQETKQLLQVNKAFVTIGYLTGFVRPKASWRPVVIAELDSMLVRDDYRSRGIGSELVKEFIVWTRKKNANYVSVTAFSRNVDALKFYKKHGFMPYSETLELKIT